MSHKIIYQFFPAIICGLSLALTAQGLAADKEVTFLGDFSHVQSSTGEHCDGYSVVLWRYKGSLIGFLSRHRGLCGDPPTGILEGLKYNPKNGSLSFGVKLSDGCVPDIGAKECIPTKDLVRFSGSLSQNILKGTVSWYADGGRKKSHTKSITLHAAPRDSVHREDFETHEKWFQYHKEMLKQLGPRW
ncbi:MAG: hypothetical protein ACREQA_05540 [Candidatus Binatia bacterium]